MADGKARCSAITGSGGRCKKPATDQLGFCWSHSQASAERRKQIASAGGKSGSRRSPSELEQVKEQIKTISALVLQRGMDEDGRTIDRSTAATLFMGYNTLLRAVELQRRLDAQEEIEARLTELEATLERKGVTGRQWGTHRNDWRN